MNIRHTFIFVGMLIALPLFAEPPRFQSKDERRIAYNMRLNCAFLGTLHNSPIDCTDLNPDETNVPLFAAQHSKTFEHDPVTGQLTANGVQAYAQMVKAMHSGLQADFNAINRAPGSARLLVSPQAGLAFSNQGKDSSLLLAQTPFSIQNARGAANLIELYWQAICRDVYFDEYGTGLGTDSDGFGGSLTTKAALVLNDFGVAFDGPRDGGVVTPDVVFRCTAQGCQVGPYVSQFLIATLYPVFQPSLGQKQYLPIAQKREFGVSWNDYITLQNGQVPKPYNGNDFSGFRYASTGRDLATYVHFDGLYEAYYNAIVVLVANGFPLSPAIPYANGSMPNEAAFADMGMPDFQSAMAAVAAEAIKACWANKWRSWRILRPEEFGGLVHRVKVTGLNPNGIDASMFALHAGIDTLQLTFERNGRQSLASIDPLQLLTLAQAQTYLLPQVYPEGCPLHSSYPSGHATVAGACVTVIKAYFNDQTLINSRMTPVKPNPADRTQFIALSGEDENIMTVGGELNKLAANIGMGRNFAGIHYRQDCDFGMELGERAAICWLQDKARTYGEENFEGFELTKFNGQRIRIKPGSVINI